MIKRFVQYYRPHWRLFSLDLVCAFLMSLIDLLFPVLTRHATNTLIPQGQIQRLLLLGAGMLVLYLIRAGFEYFVECYGHVLGVRMEYDMRKDLFGHMQSLSFRFYDKNRTGHLMSRIVNDLRDITELAHHGPEDLFISFVMIIGSFLVLVQIDWRLTLITYGFLPFIIFYAIKMRSKLARDFKEVKKKIADVNAQVENSISGIRVVHSFTNEAYEIEKFENGNNLFRVSRENAYKTMAQLMTGIRTMLNVLNVTVLLYGGWLVYSGDITVGDLLAFLLYIGLFLQPVRRLMSFTQQFEQGMAGFGRFSEIMDVRPEIVNRLDAKPIEEIQGEIRFNQVDFAYQKEESILKNIIFTIPAGKTTALVGPSGGGKTTICQLIPRFYEVTGGGISLDGRDIRDIRLESLRKNIGIVQQDVFLFAGTVAENIGYGRANASLDEMVEAAKQAEIHDFIMSLPDAYETEIGERGIRLSGGQKQRLSIARVFLKNPPILILDEATSALDNETEVKIQASLEKLSRGRTTLVIAHRLSTIRSADQILVVTDDGIEESGTHKALLAKEGVYAHLYKMQFLGLEKQGDR
ncbi:ABC transporter ATP-binding protein [Gottschalkiaceae bacterium SANA]|nr:ABC transporter ATP-binding protein [Gottschalkiaceae bacterium SANA]